MKQFFWKHLARFLAKPRIADALIRYAKRTPYMHLPSNEDPSYMERYWVFNPYDRTTNKPRWGFLCPVSIRVHHIKRKDLDRALHDHPWNARTIILKGYYEEKRLLVGDDREDLLQRQTGLILDLIQTFPGSHAEVFEYFSRGPGDTASLRFGEYHTITEVSDGGVYTLFFSSRWEGVWGFLVNGVKVPWREYLGIPEKGDLSDATNPEGGLVPHPKGGLVPHPKGEKVSWVVDSPFGCSSCNGTGNVFDESGRGTWTCYECKGTGEPSAEIGCSTCNDTGGWGQGDQVQLCPDCNSRTAEERCLAGGKYNVPGSPGARHSAKYFTPICNTIYPSDKSEP